MVRAAVVLLMLLPAFLGAQQIGVQAGSASSTVVGTGTKLTVPIVVDLSAAAGANVASLQSSLGWGTSRLTFDSLRIAAAGWSLGQTAPVSGTMTFNASNATALPGTATLANAFFTASTTSGGTRVTIAPTAAANQSAASVLSLLRVRNLDVCVADRWGDVNADGAVNIIDAQQIARWGVGLSVANAAAVAVRGDVTASGAVDIIDAQQIARWGVGLAAPGAPRVNTFIDAAPAASLALSPSTAQTLAVGSILQVTPTPRDAASNDLTGCSAVSWSSTAPAVATVSTSGLVTGVASGSTTITATSVTTPAVTASIGVTVPSAATVLFTEGFENANLALTGWYDNTIAVLTTAEHTGAGSTSSAQFLFNTGATTATSGGSMRHKFTPSNSVYISYNVKYTANWVGSGQLYHPHEFHVMTTMDADDWVGPSNSWMTLYLEHNYQNGGKPVMSLQDNQAINTSVLPLPHDFTATENRSVGGCNGGVEAGFTPDCFAVPGSVPPWYNAKTITGPVVFLPTNTGAGYKNNWNFVEAYFQLNTILGGIGLPNGVMQYWFNGVLIIDRHDVIFRTGLRPSIQFNKFLIAPYIGDGSPVTQSMFLDNLTVATGRVP